MSFKKIVVLGGGPIGLFCAIEAAQTFDSMFSKVTLVEMRADEYSRMNVPVLPDPVGKHLAHLGVKDQALGNSSNAPLSQIETAVHQKAVSCGVKMKEGWVAVDIIGKDKRGDGRFKNMAITIAPWDHAKKMASTKKREIINADLLILAVGASGIENDLFKKTLGFDTETLNASNFAIYGVYNKTKDATLGAQLQGRVKEIALTTRVPTDNSEYLLLTLKQATPADFNLLKQNSAKLRECMDVAGRAFQGSIMNELNAKDKAVGAFEVKIKRARHVISPKFPAVLVGDSAVSPHPQAGTGLLTGFHGFEALQDLLKALKETHRSSDEAVDAICAFEDSYEVYISAKALEGTIVILKHLIGLVDGYEKSCDADFAKAKGVDAKYLIRFNALGANLLRLRMESQVNRALRFGEMLHADVKRLDTKAGRTPRSMFDLSGTIDDNVKKTPATGTMSSSDSIKILWKDIGDTYQELMQLTQNYTPLQEAIQKLSAALPPRAVAPQGVQV